MNIRQEVFNSRQECQAELFPEERIAMMHMDYVKRGETVTISQYCTPVAPEEMSVLAGVLKELGVVPADLTPRDTPDGPMQMTPPDGR